MEGKWLEQYSGQTLEELLSLEGSYRIDSLIVAFEQALIQKSARDGDETLTSEERTILAVEALEREVNNGGYHQFFLNNFMEFPSFIVGIVGALRSIGCPATAGITQEAINALGISDVNTATIESALDEDNPARDEKLERCDEMFFQRDEDIEGRLFAFIKANHKAIRL